MALAAELMLFRVFSMLKHYFRMFFWISFCVVLLVLVGIFRLNNNVIPVDYARSDWVDTTFLGKSEVIPALNSSFCSSECWLRFIAANESNLVKLGRGEVAARSALASNLTDFRATAKIIQFLEAKGESEESQQLTESMLRQWPARSYHVAVANFNKEFDERLQRKIQQVDNLLMAEEKRILRELRQRKNVQESQKEKEITDIKNQIEDARRQRINQLQVDDKRLREQILLALQKKIFKD